MATTVHITIDGKTIAAEAGRNLVSVMRENGLFVPSLCYFEHHEPPLGTCRVCTCRINGKEGPACTEKVREGLAVELHTPDLDDLRKALVEMMFAEGNHYCPACEKSGNCDLQHMAYELHIDALRFPHLFKDRLIDYRPERLVLEHNRCIKCRRCVEEVLTADGKRVFTYLNRGNETVVGIDYALESSLTPDQARQAMELCPTGAIILRGESLSQPFGDRRFDHESAQQDYAAKAAAPATAPAEKKVVATVSLAGCFGCHMSLLDIDTGLLDMIELVSFDRSPLTDIKKISRRCHVGIIEGGCCNAENVETLREFRKHCDVLIAIGECAIWGGLPAMRNTLPAGECLEEAYLHSITSEAGKGLIPCHEDLPKLLDRVYACSEIVKIDHFVPGCPPGATHLWKTIGNVLWGTANPVLYSEFKYD